MSGVLTKETASRTVWFFGKPYHWTLNADADDRLSLQPGFAPGSVEEEHLHLLMEEQAKLTEQQVFGDDEAIQEAHQ